MVAFDTGFPADTVEFCPHPSARDIFVCGTYKLDDTPTEESETNTPASQHRRGQCLVFQLDPSKSVACRTFRQIQSFDLPAVLDMKWSHASLPILGIADSEGCITLHEWQETENSLKQINAIRCGSSDTLCLTLDWSNRRAVGTDPGSLIVSLSNGSLCLLHPGHNDSFASLSWHAHDFEPWAAAWNYWDTNVVYSGGDDLKMKGWDIRQDFLQPTFINKRFDAGITSIQSHPHIEHMLAVGSYDNTVRLFDTRKPLVVLTEINVGGGAWRVKWHPSSARRNDLLVACMHDGCKIVRFDFDNNNHGQVIKRFDAHESMAYGADWSFESFEEGESTIGSCSFYDHVCHIWSG